MPVQRFNHFNLAAERALLDALRDFYVDVVGLVEGNRPPFKFFGYWLYLGGQPVLHLSEVAGGAKAGGARAGSFDHVAFSCDGLADFESRLKTLGVAYRRSQVPGAQRVQLFVKDPSGNGVEFNFEHGGA